MSVEKLVRSWSADWKRVKSVYDSRPVSEQTEAEGTGRETKREEVVEL